MPHSATARLAAAYFLILSAVLAQPPVNGLASGPASGPLPLVGPLSVVSRDGLAPVFTRARQLYQETDYQGSLALLSSAHLPDAAALQLMGQNYYLLGEYKKASDTLEGAMALQPASSECAMWLGRAFGRRAETSNPLTAPGLASKARQWLEKAVAWNPANHEAIGDLFDYYLQAPGFLGGGESKAEALAARVAQRDAAEGHYFQALLSDKHQQYEEAEKHLRAAVASTNAAVRQVGHLLDLAKFLARRGRTNESESTFEQATRLSPGDPQVLFVRAQTYVQQNRNLSQARGLLEQYLKSPLHPNDPSREQAQALLKKIQG